MDMRACHVYDTRVSLCLSGLTDDDDESGWLAWSGRMDGWMDER